MNVLFRLLSPLRGRRAGTDRFGNTYWEAKRVRAGYDRPRRWVLFAGEVEASSVPPEWHGWLHHTTVTPLDENRRLPWQRDHQANMTGTALAYRPAGHDYEGGERKATAGDYEAWTPGA